VDAMVKTFDLNTIASQDIFAPTTNSDVLVIFVEFHLFQETFEFSNVPNVRPTKRYWIVKARRL
jgi:hypothetical protein